MEDGYHMVSQFLSDAETEQCLQTVYARQDLFQGVAAKAGMNLPYRVMDGYQIREHLPALVELAETRLWPLTQEVVGRPLEFIKDPKRSIRFQYYRGKKEGFRWHLDGGMYTALLTLVNTSNGATEVITPRLSRFLRPVPYVLFPFPQVLTLARPAAVVAEAGDLLVLHGGAAIHRGTNPQDGGERMVLAATFDPVGRKTSSAWEWVAHRLNY